MPAKILRNVAEDELTTYGPDAPRVTVAFTDAAGGAQSFCIGAYNAYNGTYCLLANGDRHTVYLVGGGAPVAVAEDLAASLELLVGDMDYLACLGVTDETLAEHGLAEDTTRLTLVYRKSAEGAETEETFTLSPGDTDKYGYYYANPEGTTLSMLLGGSVFHKLMTYDDARLSEGDARSIP